MKRKFNVLVTHSTIHQDGVSYLEANDCNVHFSNPYLQEDALADLLYDLKIDALMVRQGKISEKVIQASPTLKVIVKHGVGVDNIDIIAAQKCGIPVLKSLGSNANAVAEHTVAFILMLVKKLMFLDTTIRQGQWIKPQFIGEDFLSKTVGLVGLGYIGKLVADKLSLLGMTVMVFDPFANRQGLSLKFVDDIGELLQQSDIVSLHCPLTPTTKHIINEISINLMKDDAYLVNTARGGLIDEGALAIALNAGKIAGAALDSFEDEPIGETSPLLHAKNVILTPHVAGVTYHSSAQMALIAAKHIVSVLHGNNPDPQSVCGLNG